MAMRPSTISLSATKSFFSAAKLSLFVDVATATSSHASYFSLKNQALVDSKGDS